ncbi:telethonin-like [Coregonus clupeaformis]|uniref:telethonin-like n=1 Tax=Coregonus clupeaformis TaxID=59861 RepID=UPI001BE0F507|nr:telethonin-like [Coregonus clupeaformis]
MLYTHKINSLNSGDVYLVNAHCDVKEKDQEKKESYQATWLDLVMETRPEQQTTLFENDYSRKETYKQKQVAHFLVQRNPSQQIKMGTRGGMLKEYQLPYKNALRVPIFTPSKAASPKDLYRTPSPSEYKSIMEFETIAKGVCSDKQEIFEITKDLPKVSQPIRVNFRASSLISPTREFSHSFRG